MIGTKKIVWLFALATLLLAGLIKLAVANDELTTLLLASAQVGSSDPVNENVDTTDQKTIEPQPEQIAEPEPVPEKAQPPLPSEDKIAAPKDVQEKESISEPIAKDSSFSENTNESIDTTGPVPALPAPVALPDTKANIGEPMRRDQDSQKRMKAIDALRYLLGDLDGLKKGTDNSQRRGFGDRYLVKPGDTLDIIIKETMSHVPIRKGILRRAFVETNTHAFPSDSPHRLLAGMYIKIPSVEDIRDIIFPKGLPEELQPKKLVNKKTKQSNTKDWVRFP